jgi:hypothetical protein
MLEIPLNANVVCLDGHAGKSTHVVIDPRKRVVTHVVVKGDKDFAAQDRLVPIDHIHSSTRDVIRLNYTLEEFAQLPPFSETRYVDYDYAYSDAADYGGYVSVYSGMPGPYAIPTAPTGHIPMVDEAMPQGERALMQGAKVQATDGAVGTVGELIIDGQSGAITHFTLQEGHFWGKREVTLPLSAVDHAEENTV